MEEIEDIQELEVKTKPLSSRDRKLQEKFTEETINQSSLMDSIAKQLITIELAIPGVYATALKLTVDSDATPQHGAILLSLTFLLWFIALAFTFLAMFPRQYKVNIERLDEIEKFFIQSAKYKRRMLMISAFIFFAGVTTSIFTIF